MSTATPIRETPMPGLVAPYSPERYAEWRARHNNAPFSPQFNSMLVRTMCDPDVDGPSRFMAWLTLYAGGNHSDWPVDPNGKEKSQADCSRETGMNRRRVSEAVQFCAARGWVTLEVNRMIQADGGSSPSVPFCPDVPDKSEEKANFPAYRTYWLERQPDLKAGVDRAKEYLKTIDLQILQDWKRERQTWVPPAVTPAAQGEEMANTELPADPDLSERVGQLVRDVPDNVSGTFRTNGAPIIRTVESLNKQKPSSSSLHSSSVTEEAPSASTTTIAPTFDPTAPLNRTLFHQELQKTFVDGDKPAPAKKQSDRAFTQVQAEARGFYVQDIRSRIGNIHHPGVLATDAATFAQSWPHRKAKLQAEWEQRRKFAERQAEQRAEETERAAETLRKEEDYQAACIEWIQMPAAERAPFIKQAEAILRQSGVHTRVTGETWIKQVEESAVVLYSAREPRRRKYYPR